MGYLAAAFAKGASDEYIKQGDEERAAKLQEIRDRRLSGLRMDELTHGSKLRREELGVGSGLRREENELQSGHRKDEATHQQSLNEKQAAADFDREMQKPRVVQEGADLVVTDQQNPTGPATSIYQNPKDFSPGGGADSAFSPKDATKFFSARAEKYFGQLDESGQFTSFGSDENAQMASAAASVADRMWRQNQGRVDPNTTWAIVYKKIKEDKATTAQDITALEQELAKYDEMWWLNEAEEAEVQKITEDLKAAEQQGQLQQMQVPGTDAGGYLSQTQGAGVNNPQNSNTQQPQQEQQDGIPTLSTKEEVDMLPRGTVYRWGPTGKKHRKK